MYSAKIQVDDHTDYMCTPMHGAQLIIITHTFCAKLYMYNGHVQHSYMVQYMLACKV